MIANDTSQAGQTRFAAHVLNYKRGGTFVDFGCAHPIEWNNSFALEAELGWGGLLLDSSAATCALCQQQRKGTVVCADATKFDFAPAFCTLGPVLDYASVDVDEFQVAALLNLMACADHTGTRFRVMTIETDAYRFGEGPRTRIVDMLCSRGYDLIADRVKSQGCDFETFWVDPALVDMARVEPFRSTSLEWADVLRQGGLTV